MNSPLAYARISAAKGVQHVGNRWRLGSRRVVNQFPRILQMAFAAAASYGIAQVALGHKYPFLAATAAAVSVGVASDVRLRRAAEYALGATIGVVIGELMVHFMGSGVWQMFVVMLAGLCVARLLDSGTVFGTQVAIQSVYVVSIPTVNGGAFPRTQDAIVGGLVAIAMAAVIPHDPRREPRVRARAMIDEVTGILDLLAEAARDADPAASSRALTRGRDTQELIDSWQKSVKIARESARISPAGRRYAADVNRLARACTFLDRAMRLLRVVARRMSSALADQSPRLALANAITEIAVGTRALRSAVNDGTSRDDAARLLRLAAGKLQPGALHPQDLQAETIVLLLRPMVVDLLQAAGVGLAQARAALPGVVDDQ